MTKGHDKGHKGQMSDREVMKLALEALDQYIEKELTVGQRYTNEGQQLLEAHAILRQALNHVPDTMKMTEPDMGIDRGAWADVPDATKWVDELRGGDEEPPNSTTDVVESEPVAWCEINSIGEIMYFDGRAMIMPGKFGNDLHTVPLYTAPPKQSEQTVSLEEYKRLQRLVTSQGIRLMEYESEQEPVACIVGMKGSAYDSPETKRAYTYEHQPHNVVAWKLGEACSNASRAQAGDYIDRCLVLLKELQAAGYGVFDLGAEYTAPPKREWVGLTEEEIANIANACRWSKGYHSDFARAIETKLKEKNR